MVVTSEALGKVMNEAYILALRAPAMPDNSLIHTHMCHCVCHADYTQPGC